MYPCVCFYGDDRGIRVQSVQIGEKIKEFMTPLMRASEAGFLDVVKALVTKNSKVDEQNNVGGFALAYACISGNLEAVKYLVDAKCNLNLRANNNRNALSYALSGGHSDIAEYLIEKGADVISDCGIGIPLNYCFEKGEVLNKVTVLLLEKGFDIPYEEINGLNDLHKLVLKECNPLPRTSLVVSAGGREYGTFLGPQNLIARGNQVNNKWVHPDVSESFIQCEFTESGGKKISQYALCSGDDIVKYDPCCWKLLGKKFGENDWIEIHAVSNYKFSNRWENVWFKVESIYLETSFSAVKLEILDTLGSFNEKEKVSKKERKSIADIKEETSANVCFFFIFTYN